MRVTNWLSTAISYCSQVNLKRGLCLLKEAVVPCNVPWGTTLRGSKGRWMKTCCVRYAVEFSKNQCRQALVLRSHIVIRIIVSLNFCVLISLQAPHCEHAFCNACITQWFAQQQICPVDRTVVTLAHLRPVPRIMRNMLSKLQINCDNAGFGCTATLRLDQLQSHLKDCEHNPKRPVNCEEGCGWVGCPPSELESLLHLDALLIKVLSTFKSWVHKSELTGRACYNTNKAAQPKQIFKDAVKYLFSRRVTQIHELQKCMTLVYSEELKTHIFLSLIKSCRLEMPKDELPNHNCIKHLRSVVQQQQTKISELEKTVAEHKHQLGEQVRIFIY